MHKPQAKPEPRPRDVSLSTERLREILPERRLRTGGGRWDVKKAEVLESVARIQDGGLCKLFKCGSLKDFEEFDLEDERAIGGNDAALWGIFTIG